VHSQLHPEFLERPKYGTEQGFTSHKNKTPSLMTDYQVDESVLIDM
jgi:hypothetical protein